MEFSTLVADLHVAGCAKEPDIRSIYQALQGVSDGRARRGRRYMAAVGLTIILLAKLAGEQSLRGIAQWARLRQAWLVEALRVKAGKLPCANTYRYLCDHIDLGELNEALGQCFAARRPTHLALDGKSLHGTRRSGIDPKLTVHVVGLYNVDEQSMWRQRAVAAKARNGGRPAS